MDANAADRALIAHAGKRGFAVTARQLKRWRAYGVLPERSRLNLGRGRGTTSADSPVTRYQLVSLCERLAADRRLDRAALWLWYEGWDVKTTLVRDQVCELHGRGLEELLSARKEAALQGDSQEVDPFAVGHVLSHAHPVTREEARRMRALASQLKSTDEPLTAEQLVHDARVDILAATLSSESVVLDEDLLLHSIGGVDVARLAPAVGMDLTDELARGIVGIYASEDGQSRLQDAPDASYLGAREALRRNWEAIPFVRANLDQALAETPDPDLELALTTLVAGPTGYDPRDPRYAHDKLLLALASAVIGNITTRRRA
jgi:hypothetical protein